MKRDPTTRAFVGRGEATASNPLGVAVTHRFVCLIDPDRSAGKGRIGSTVGRVRVRLTRGLNAGSSAAYELPLALPTRRC
jgi:hypothetical protein